MSDDHVKLTAIGGPTAIIEIAGSRLLTDPTFDPAGSIYSNNVSTLEKISDPALGAEAIGPIDAVLLSHDHHRDNLDQAGRSFLPNVKHVLTTTAGAERLAGNATGLQPWQSIDLPAPNDQTLRVTATPARHGPPDGDRGPVIGFILQQPDRPDHAVYVSGDTVWFDGVAEVSRRFPVGIAILFMGAARVVAAGPDHLTFTANEGVTAAEAFADALIVPIHSEGWKHFSENRADIERAFAAAGLSDRLRWLQPGQPTALDW